jgi:hypothetical protein
VRRLSAVLTGGRFGFDDVSWSVRVGRSGSDRAVRMTGLPAPVQGSDACQGHVRAVAAARRSIKDPGRRIDPTPAARDGSRSAGPPGLRFPDRPGSSVLALPLPFWRRIQNPSLPEAGAGSGVVKFCVVAVAYKCETASSSWAWRFQLWKLRASSQRRFPSASLSARFDVMRLTERLGPRFRFVAVRVLKPPFGSLWDATCPHRYTSGAAEMRNRAAPGRVSFDQQSLDLVLAERTQRRFGQCFGEQLDQGRGPQRVPAGSGMAVGDHGMAGRIALGVAHHR